MKFANQQPRNTTQAGYGNQHMQARARAFAMLPEWSACVRCGQLMWKHQTEPDGKGHQRSALHYDHNPARTGYLGFSHARCNDLAGARLGGHRSQQSKRTRTHWTIHSRPW